MRLAKVAQNGNMHVDRGWDDQCRKEAAGNGKESAEACKEER